MVDRYRYWSMEAIVADLDTRRHDFHVAIENWQHDFNIGTIVRSANAFLAAEVHIVGNRRWNRRGAMVTDRYQHVRHHETAADLAAYLHGLPGGPVSLLGIDNLPGSQHLETMTVPRRVCFLFGQEGPGLSEGARGVRRDVLDRAVRLDPVDQRLRGRGDRHAHLDPRVRRPVRRRRLAGLTDRSALTRSAPLATGPGPASCWQTTVWSPNLQASLPVARSHWLQRRAAPLGGQANWLWVGTPFGNAPVAQLAAQVVDDRVPPRGRGHRVRQPRGVEGPHLSVGSRAAGPPSRECRNSGAACLVDDRLEPAGRPRCGLARPRQAPLPPGGSRQPLDASPPTRPGPRPARRRRRPAPAVQQQTRVRRYAGTARSRSASPSCSPPR